MSHLNIYVPDTLEREIRQKAEESGESISKFLARFFKRQLEKKKEWHKDFFSAVVGRWQGTFPEIERGTAEERDDL